MTFASDLALGNNYETILINKLPHDTCNRPKGMFKEYDFELMYKNKVIKYEVKCDRLSYKTSNIAIEYECNNKPSGISTTTADYFAYFILSGKDKSMYTLFIVPTEYIRKKIKEKYYMYETTGGDRHLSRMYLFNVNVFLDYHRPELSTQTIDKVFLKPVVRESGYDDDE